MTRAIIFDCFGVLTDDLWKAFVNNLPEEQKIKARTLNHALDAGQLAHQDFYQAIHALTGSSPKTVEGIITSEMHKNRALLSYIALLKQHYKIGLLSNISTDWVTRKFLSKEEIALFDDMVFSYQIGVTKPDTRAYELTAARIGEKTTDCIFVDDSPSNCEGAENAGMKAIVYTNFDSFKASLETLLA